MKTPAARVGGLLDLLEYDFTLLPALAPAIVIAAQADPAGALRAVREHRMAPRIEPLIYAVGLVGKKWIPANGLVREVGEDILRMAKIAVPRQDELKVER